MKTITRLDFRNVAVASASIRTNKQKMTIEQQNPSETIRFAQVQWHLPGLVAEHIRLDSAAPVQLQQQINQALNRPHGLENLQQLFVAGDSVALAIDPRLPSLEKVVACISNWLVEHGVNTENLQIVVTNPHCAAAVAQQFQGTELDQVHLECHDPDNADKVSYVAADEDAQAIYINRALVDADVVIPVCCAKHRLAIDYLGPFSLFPLFSDRETSGHFESYLRLCDQAEHRHLSDRCNQASWWLGTLASIQVIPGPLNQVCQVVSGLMENADSVAVELLSNASAKSAGGEMYDLVIACLDGPDQGWREIARALHAASRYCSSGGSIAVCSQSQQTPGPSLRRLRDGQSDRQQIEKRLQKDSGEDTLAAGAILETTRDHHVYLASQHNPSTIESLGMSPIGSQQQLLQLAGRHSRLVVLESAQHL